MSKKYSYSIIYRQVSKFIDQNIISGDVKAIVEDVMQELYMEFFKAISQFRNEDPKSFYKWIMVVANRKVLRYVDKNKMEVLQKQQESDDKDFEEQAEEAEHSSEFVPDLALETKEFQRLMKKFIKKLLEEQVQTIIYHIYGGLKYQEIADIMGVSLITVKTRMRKAKDSLREMISGYEKKIGTRLTGIVPIPLIGFYLRVYMEQSKMPISVDFKLFNQIRKYIDQSVSAISRYMEAIKQVDGVKELVVGVVVATVVGTGTIGVVQHNQPTEPEPTPIVEEKEEDTEKDEIKKEEPPQGVIEHPVEIHTYFIYWDNKTIDVSSYVHEVTIMKTRHMEG